MYDMYGIDAIYYTIWIYNMDIQHSVIITARIGTGLYCTCMCCTVNFFLLYVHTVPVVIYSRHTILSSVGDHTVAPCHIVEPYQAHSTHKHIT